MKDQNVLKAAVAENLSKPKGERLTCKQMGEIHGVSGPRISQIAAGLKVKPEVIPTEGQPEAQGAA